MNISKPSKILFNVVSVVVAFLVSLGAGTQSDPLGVLYENADKSGKSINYFEYPADFSDVQDLIDSQGLSSAASFCARGVFILYNQEVYNSDADEDVVILAGTDTCLPPGSMKSALFAQGHLDTKTDTITIFQGERLSTPTLLINRQYENFPRPVQQFGKIQSFILMGSRNWTISTKAGTTYCMKAGVESEFPVCPVAYASTYFTNEDDQSWVQAQRGCTPGSFSSVITLAYCFNHGSGKLEPIVGSSTPPTTTTRRPGGALGAGFLDNCDDLEEYAMLMKIRMTHDFNNLYQVQFPFDKAHAWRTEILDNTMEIIAESYVDELVHRQVLLFVREMYIYFAEKNVWGKGNAWPSTRPTQRVKLVAHETARCLRRMRETGALEVSKEYSQLILDDMDDASPGFKEEDIDEFFKTIDGNDIVMEFIWLSINIVGGACHAVLEFDTDFWMEYINVAMDMYLHPMADFWGNPEKVLSYYPSLLGGYDIQRQYKGLAIAATNVYKLAQVDKLPRPEQVNQGVTDASVQSF